MYLDTWNVVAGSASDTGGLGGLGISLGDASDILQLVSRRQNEVKKKPRPSQEYIIEKFSKPMGIKPKRNRVISMDEEIQVGLGNVSDERFDVSMDDFDFDTESHNTDRHEDSNKLISNTDAVNDYKKSSSIYANENNVDYDNNLDDAVNNSIGLNSDNATEEKLTEESYELYNSLFSGNIDTMRNEDYNDNNEYDPLDDLDFGDGEDDYDDDDDEGYEEDYTDPLDELDFGDDEDDYSEDDDDYSEDDELEPPIMEKAVINQPIQVVTPPVEKVNNPQEIVEPKNVSQVHDPLDELDFEDEEEDNYDPLDELDWEDEYAGEDYDEADEEDNYDPLDELDFEDEEDAPDEYVENNKATSTIIKEAQPVINPTVIAKDDKLVDVQSTCEIHDESLTLVSDREKELQERLAKARLKQEQARLKQLEEEVLAAEAEADRLEAENKTKATKILSNATKEQKKVDNTITKKDDSIDKLINNQSKRQTKVIKEKEKFSGDSVKRKPSKIDMYSAMKDNELYLEVRKFLKSREIQRKPVNIKELNEEFGADNIRKLLTRSYLISTGKGVTVGR